MSITEQVQKDMTVAMKARDRRRTTALRMILSALQLAAKEAGGGFGEKEELAVLAAEKKRRLQAAEAFRDGGRQDRAAAEKAEAELIDTYLPAGLEDEQLKAIIREAISETGAAGMADMGRVMKVAMERVAARADGKVVSEMAREALSG
ncbi:Yqey-like protein [bacterium BMS3Abin01]|nr:Yqey-like protein [bacterium BMS3Abin01]HDY69317.1 hypothetical protein [Actinomycetota bacterium]